MTPPAQTLSPAQISPFAQILPPAQREIYPHLKAITQLGFTLFGGTALALQLGHRSSVDFDFFTDKNIAPLHSRLLGLRGISVGEITQKSAAELSFKTKNGVKFSFFGGLGFVRRAGKFYTDDGVLRLADLRALLITTLKATCDRACYKDYFDIIAILKTRRISLREGLAGVGEFFGGDFPHINVLKALVYFDDGDLWRLGDGERRFLRGQVAGLRGGGL